MDEDTVHLRDVYLEARHLFRIGLNVFPQPAGQKMGFPWKGWQYTRAYKPYLQHLFWDRCNLAVMCGRTSRNLFVIDAETMEALDKHLLDAQRRQLPVWAAHSTRGGHLYFLCQDGEVENVKPGILPDAEIRGRNGYVIAPPSVHPSAAYYEWIRRDGEEPPTVQAAQIDWLVDVEGQPVTLKVKRPRALTSSSPVAVLARSVAEQYRQPGEERFWHLSRKTLHYLQGGGQLTQGTRNRRLFEAACDMSGCNFASSDIRNWLGEQAFQSGLPAWEIDKTLDSALGRLRQPVRKRGTTPTAPTKRPRYAIAAIQAQAWTGRTSTTDRMVAYALYERLRQGGNQDGAFRASYRELRVLARIGNNNTIKNALRRLVDAKIVVPAGKDTRSEASLWRFHDEFLIFGREAIESGSYESEPLYLSKVRGAFVSEEGIHSINGSVLWETNEATDAAERGALGLNGLMVYHALCEAGAPLSPRTLVEITGLSPNQVAYALRKLLKWGLAEKSGRTYVVTVRLDANGLDQKVAAPLGKLGKARRRQDEIVKERARFVTKRVIRYRERKDRHYTGPKQKSSGGDESVSSD